MFSIMVISCYMVIDFQGIQEQILLAFLVQPCMMQWKELTTRLIVVYVYMHLNL